MNADKTLKSPNVSKRYDRFGRITPKPAARRRSPKSQYAANRQVVSQPNTALAMRYVTGVSVNPLKDSAKTMIKALADQKKERLSVCPETVATGQRRNHDDETDWKSDLSSWINRRKSKCAYLFVESAVEGDGSSITRTRTFEQIAQDIDCREEDAIIPK